MDIDEGPRIPATNQREVAESRNREWNATRIVLVSLLGLLLVAAAFYFYAVDGREGIGVASAPSPRQSREGSAAATQPRSAGSTEKSLPSTSPSQPPSDQSIPSEAAVLQQSRATLSPPPVTTAQERPTPPPATTAPNATSNASAMPKDSGAHPGAGTQTTVVGQQLMQDQPAALPDQPAAAPMRDMVFVVKRGPANIRSAPGKAGRVIGSAAKNTRVKQIGRSGSWVEVETEAGRGWISSALLGSASPESR
jgi:hypothetical protein